MGQDLRLGLIEKWLRAELAMGQFEIAPASADASFRRYFRVTRGVETCIVMDAPPDKEDLEPFLRVDALLASTGVNVPRVMASDKAQGFLLLSDLGSRQYLTELTQGGDVERLYGDALQALAAMQIRGRDFATELAPYDRALLVREMELLPEWFLERHLGIAVDRELRQMLDRLYEALVQAALEQPASFVHRDYHSRNLMLTSAHNPGILDFQDAVYGAVTYDLVSLLKDCYIAWPAERVRGWALAHRAALAQAGFAVGAEPAQFLRWFDLMGLQRHIKVLGIFARLWYRDGKRNYLTDLPLVLQYTRSAAEQYPETREFAQFLQERVQPAFALAQTRVLS
jgi:aminoglycoside/choline kinase family phosphotransferase